jgi:hypothetical protein
LLTAPFAVLATAFFFVISFLSIWRVCRLDAVPSYDGPSGGVLRKIREGLRVVVGDGSLRAVALATCVYQFSFAALISDLVMLCTSGVRGSGTFAIAALIAINFLYGVARPSTSPSWRSGRPSLRLRFRAESLPASTSSAWA